MEPSSQAPKAPRPRLCRRKVVAILVAVAIGLAAFATWQFIRPRTIGEVLSMEHLQPGTEIPVQGTITGIGRELTTYGPRVHLQLDGNTVCGGTDGWSGNVLGDPNGSYRLGDTYHRTLHLQTFSINGRPAVWAPELTCPFQAGFRSIGVVFDGISRVRDMVLVYNATDPGGWARYDIRTENATGFSPDLLPVFLLKALPLPESLGPIDSAAAWIEVEGLFYVAAAATLGADVPGPPGFSIADRMTSFTAASTNGTLRFVDADSNGRVDSGDGLEVRLPQTGSATGWESYLVMIGNWSAMATSYGAAVHVILVGPTGPLEALSPGSWSSFPNLRSKDRSLN